MHLSARYARHQRQSALIDEQMVFASDLAAVGGIGAGMLSAEGGMARWPSRYWRVPIESDRTALKYFNFVQCVITVKMNSL